MMKRGVLVLLLMAAVALPDVCARKVRSGPAKLRRNAAPVERYDTVVDVASTLACSGYDKPNGATRETFFITNTDTLCVDAVNLTLDYFDMKGRKLHSATHTVRVELPPGQTRNVSVRSWDINNAFHYFRSQAPKRRASTPFGVKARINYGLRVKGAE